MLCASCGASTADDISSRYQPLQLKDVTGGGASRQTIMEHQRHFQEELRNKDDHWAVWTWATTNMVQLLNHGDVRYRLAALQLLEELQATQEFQISQVH